MNNRSVANGASFANGNGPGTIHAWQSGYQRLAILVEEVGEVAHELTYDQGGRDGRRDELVKELIQVAAMAASWIEHLEGGRS